MTRQEHYWKVNCVYVKFLQVSDDEDDTHPNIDTPSLFRWRHEARVQRMQEMEEERADIQKNKDKLKEMKKKLEEMKEKGEDVTAKEKEYNTEARKLADRENAFAKKEKLSPWNVDTIAKDGFSKTVINSKPNKSQATELTEEEKGQRLKDFTKENKTLLKEFGMLRKFDDSKRFLQEHPQLVCEDTANYLVLWCIELAMEEKFDLMDHVSHQCISMQFLMELAKQLDRDPRTCVSSFFTKIAHAEQTEYQQAFDTELELFRQRIRKRAEEKVKELIDEAEEEERKARLGPGGLDPVEVFQTLPEVLQKCFEAQDIPMLQKAISEMPEAEAKYHMKRCVDSGLWCPAKEDAEPQPQKRANTSDQEGEGESEENESSNKTEEETGDNAKKVVSS